MQKINEAVYQDAKVSEIFATLSIIILNKTRRTVKYAGAGDLPLVFKNSMTNSIENVGSKGMLLGFSAEGEYEDVTLNLNSGDCLLLHTDGITESRNAAKEQFGTERFMETVAAVNHDEDHLEKIKNEITAFTNDNFEDDISLIVVKVK